MASTKPSSTTSGPQRSRSRRRSFGAVEKLPSGRYRARVLGPDGKYFSAPMTFATRTDAGVWVDLQRADMVRGLWRSPARRRGSVTVGEYVARWIAQHPTAKTTTRELYSGLLRTCIQPTLGRVRLAELMPDAVRRWHFELGERLSADAEARRAALCARGRKPSAASVSDGRGRQAQAYRLLRAAMATAVRDELIDSQPCRIAGAGVPRHTLERSTDLAQRLLSPTQVAMVAEVESTDVMYDGLGDVRVVRT
jgi:hypothetical protein